MIIMSVDFGDSRTGIAVCGKSEMIASPVTVIAEKDFDKCIEKTAALAKEQRAEQIVVGYPKKMNGTIGERAEKCALFAQELEKHTKTASKTAFVVSYTSCADALSASTAAAIPAPPTCCAPWGGCPAC